MKKTTGVCSWGGLFDFLVAAGTIALLVYWDRRRMHRRRIEAKLDDSLKDTFPASDPVQF